MEFFAIPGEFSLNRSTSFRSGRVYGMDVTSGAAVAALLFDLYDLENTQDEINVTDAKRENAQHLQKKDPIQSAKGNSRALNVLDLCCAPG